MERKNLKEAEFGVMFFVFTSGMRAELKSRDLKLQYNAQREHFRGIIW